MKKLIRILSLFLILILCLSMTACGTKKYGQWYDKKNEKADQSNLFGMCGLLYSNEYQLGIPWKESIELYKNMGVKSIRNWMHFNWLLKDKDTINRGNADILHAMLAKEIEYGIQIIGMNHSSFKPEGYVNSDLSTAKPRRDLTEGSLYMQWLEDYEQSWFTLVSEFPEVEYWEIDNETNNTIFMPILDGGYFTILSQMADIYTDMMFFASRGIHRANPNAITMMGGMVPETAAGFLKQIYDNIFAEDSWSQYPDDYFQTVAWHPYDNSFCEASVDRWVEHQKKIYSVIKEREGKDKKVFFTEVGWSDYIVNKETKLHNIEALYTMAKEELPFVEAIHIFRPFDTNARTFGIVDEKTFGLFNDPLDYPASSSDYVLGAPKEVAYLYQRLAGGTGDLTIMERWSAENVK